MEDAYHNLSTHAFSLLKAALNHLSPRQVQHALSDVHRCKLHALKPQFSIFLHNCDWQTCPAHGLFVSVHFFSCVQASWHAKHNSCLRVLPLGTYCRSAHGLRQTNIANACFVPRATCCQPATTALAPLCNGSSFVSESELHRVPTHEGSSQPLVPEASAGCTRAA